jgi:AcrR family transcriptional regulator
MNTVQSEAEHMPDKIENAREILLEQGKTLLLQYGYSGLKVRDLTGRCGMASGTFYCYFQNKDDLVYQLMDIGWTYLFGKIESAMNSDLSLHDKLAVIFSELTVRERTYRAVFAKTPVVPGRFSDYYMASMARLDRIFENIITAEIRSGNIALPVSPRMTAHIMTRFLVSASTDPAIGYEDLWRLMKLS